jgi:hypothetical protein
MADMPEMQEQVSAGPDGNETESGGAFSACCETGARIQ